MFSKSCLFTEQAESTCCPLESLGHGYFKSLGDKSSVARLSGFGCLIERRHDLADRSDTTRFRGLGYDSVMLEGRWF